MKKIKIFSTSAVLFGLLLSSCSSTQHSYRTSNIPNKNVISGEVVVDTKLDFTKKIQATSSSRNSVDEAKEEAYYKAILENNIDIIVDPIYQIVTMERILFFGGKSTAKISGFGANYVNPRTKVEAIGEMSKVDTTNISKFDAIYFNKPLKKAASKAAAGPALTSDSASSQSKIGASSAAQPKKSFAKSGLTVELVSINSTINKSTDTNSGFGVGISKYTSISNKMGLAFGLGYASEGTGSFDLNYLRVPLMVNYEIFNRFTIGGGGQLGFCLSSSDPGPGFEINTLDYGLLSKLGYRLSKSLSVELKSYMGISQIFSGYDNKNKNSQIGLSYYF